MKHTKNVFFLIFYSWEKVPNCDCVTSVKCWNVTIVCTVISHWHQRRFHFNFFCRPHSPAVPFAAMFLCCATQCSVGGLQQHFWRWRCLVLAQCLVLCVRCTCVCVCVFLTPTFARRNEFGGEIAWTNQKTCSNDSRREIRRNGVRTNSFQSALFVFRCRNTAFRAAVCRDDAFACVQFEANWIDVWADAYHTITEGLMRVYAKSFWSLTKMENLRIRRRQWRSMANGTAACCWWCNQTTDDCLHKIIYEYICKCHRRRC